MKRNTIVEIISALFILLFVYTGLNKFLEPDKFDYALKDSPIISNYHTTIAWALPTMELIVAVALFIPKTRKWGLYGSLGLMIIFTIYLSYMIAFAPNLPCSCGGVIQLMTWKQHLIFNFLFTALAFTAIRLIRKRKEREREIEPPPVVFT